MQDAEMAWEETFVAAGQAVTAPGYQVLPFDQDLSIFQEGGRFLLELQKASTPEEFDEFCRTHAGGPASAVAPLLDVVREMDGAE